MSAPSRSEAAFGQLEPAVASNGLDYFAIWRDERSSQETSRRFTLRGSRIDAAGRWSDPFGVPIGENIYRAAVASTGRGYLIVYSEYGGKTFARHVDDEGRIDATATELGQGYVYALASNGRGYLLLLSDPAASEFSAMPLDLNGDPQGQLILGRLRDPALVVTGDDYSLIDQKWTCDGVTPCKVAVRLTTIGGITRDVRERVIGPEVSQWTRVNALSANGRIFIGIISDGSPETGPAQRTISLLVVDSRGDVVQPPRVVATLPSACYCGTWRASLAWDGTSVLLGFPKMRFTNGVESDSNIVGVRFRNDGTAIDTQPFDVTDQVATEFVSASSRSGVLLLSTEQRRPIRPYFFAPTDLFARRVTTLAELTDRRAIESVVESSPLQSESAVAAMGTRAIVVWRELDQPSAIRAASVNLTSQNATPAVTLAERSDVQRTGAAVASLSDVALVTWREESDGVRILGRRIDSNGVVRDAQPIVIAHNQSTQPALGTTAVASDGNQFLVVWNYEQEVYAARVSADGKVLDAQPILVSRDVTDHFHLRVGPRVVWTGRSFLVAWSDDTNSRGLLITPPLPPRLIVRVARVSKDGEVLDAVSPTIVDEGGPVVKLALAVNGDTVMPVWGGTFCVQALPLDLDGRPTATSPRQVHCETAQTFSGVPPEVTIAAKDRGFTVFWSGLGTHDIRGRDLSPAAIAGQSFVVSPRDAWSAAATNTMFGTLVTYSRVAEEPQYGGVARVFARIVDPTPAQAKPRAARR